MFSILVVEDDINLNKLICSVLSQNGYKPYPAPNEDGKYIQVQGPYGQQNKGL